ncbi:NADH-quinone oxidoreductase subunit N [compost metagenome]
MLAAVGSGGTAGSAAGGAGSAAGGAGDLPAPDGGAILGEATHLTEWAGLGKRSPWLAGAFALFLLSMAGIPLTAGFIAKFTAFGAAVAVGAWPLALIGVLASAVSVFFYVRIIVLMFFTPSPSSVAGGVEQESPENADGGPAATSAVAALATRVTVVRSEGFTTVAIVICVTGVVLLGVLPSSVLDLALEAAKFRP